MDELQVRIIELEPMRVAFSLGFGKAPELDAWSAIVSFAGSKGLLTTMQERRFFGFNNPDPSPGSPNYGYEQWITVDEETEEAGTIKIKDFPGGRYAVMHCPGLNIIGQRWQQLVEWWANNETHEAAPSNLPCLEQLLNPELLITPEGEFNFPHGAEDKLLFELYLPLGDPGAIKE